MSATPSPWEVYDGQNRDAHWHRHACVWSTSAGHLVAYTDFMTAEMAVANARLIAAAPNMLAILKRVDSMCDALSDAGYFNDCRYALWRDVSSIIAKAEGTAP